MKLTMEQIEKEMQVIANSGMEEIIVGVVGELQFEVLTYRLKSFMFARSSQSCTIFWIFYAYKQK